MAEFTVTTGEESDRLDVLVARRTGLSRNLVEQRIAAGLVTINGARRPKSHRCEPGDHVVVAEPEPAPAPVPPALPPLRYRDDHLAVLAKPAGLVVHAGAGHAGDTLVDALRAAGFPRAGPDPERPGIVHRLDRDTSGLLIVALTDEAHRGLVRQLKDHEVERTYLALVVGHPVARARLDGPIGRDPVDRTRFAVVADGKPAVTTWERVVEIDDPACAVLACRLETGRTHQIRVHASAAGHPVAGDDRYGGARLGARLGLERMFLHAASLAFDHPVTGERLALNEPLPDDLQRALESAGVSASDLPLRL
jgi:23S rRNA pseudouridine1911/1915/1917 synthase